MTKHKWIADKWKVTARVPFLLSVLILFAISFMASLWSVTNSVGGGMIASGVWLFISYKWEET